MIRRSPIETKINHERWLVSYADFITLLFAFFVVMYSVSQVNESKYRTLSATLESVFESKKNSDKAKIGAQEHFELGSLDDFFADLKGAELLHASGALTTRGNEKWLEIELDANLLFISGSAKINPISHQLLTEVAEVLKKRENAISIEGHTDNVPIANARFRNNWQLSAERAVSVLDFLALRGVQPSRLSAVGYGEYRPVANNNNEEGRGRNRRVVIRVANHAMPEYAPSDDAEPVEKEPSPAFEAIEQSASGLNSRSEITVIPEPLQPVRLESGGILFSSDPGLPRNNAPVSSSNGIRSPRED